MKREQTCRPWLDGNAQDPVGVTHADRRYPDRERPKFLGVFFRLAPAGSRKLARWAYVAAMLFLGKYAFFAGLAGYLALGLWFRIQRVDLPKT